jgi:peptidoglycan hydrolase-like protein with peptidoglycan-binding domain
LSSPSFRSSVLGLAAAFAAACLLFVPAFASAQSASSQAASGNGQAASGSGQAAKLGLRTVKPGERGALVKQLQRLLRKAGFATSVDGIYGPGTQRTVGRFQRAARLKVNGIATRQTIARLRKAASGKFSINTVGGYDADGESSNNRNLGDRIPLKRGMSGRDIRSLQRYLRRAGFRTAVDGEFGSATYRTVRRFEQEAEKRVDGIVDAADIDALRSLVEGDRGMAPATPTEPAPLGPGEEATVGKDGLAIAPAAAPDAVKQIIAAGNAIATKPYRYGGGHGRWNDTGYDCSGSVSYALHGAGLLDQALTSGDFTRWGAKGAGRWVTIYGNSGHAYMVVAGLRFDTSGRQQDGTRWHASSRSSSGYVATHPPGL